VLSADGPGHSLTNRSADCLNHLRRAGLISKDVHPYPSLLP
jgi:hypothetical protein